MKALRLLACLGLASAVFTGCSSRTVNFDYDHQADFSQYKTYQYAKGTPAKNPLVDQRIVAAVEEEMISEGFSKASSNPDVMVTYHAATDTQSTFVTDSYGYGYGAGWRWRGMGGMGTSTTRQVDYEIGTLVVDVYDAKKKQLVFRGTASDTVSDDPEKVTKLIKSIVADIFKNYPPSS